jgi:hypothetical protein
MFLSYADDIALPGKNCNAPQHALKKLEGASKLTELDNSDIETKILIIRRSRTKEEDR